MRLLFLTIVAGMFLSPCRAQDLAPRAYIITPLHSNAITLAWGFYDGSIDLNGLPVSGTGTYSVPIFSYYHSFMFGGNSNWRGPIWMPVNGLIIRALLQFYLYYGDNFKIECPTGSGKLMNLYEVSQEIAERLERIFVRDSTGRRPVYGGTEKFQSDPRWRDNILFYEYFHGDNGAGLGASHQTGWTGAVAKLIQLYGFLDAKWVLEVGNEAAFTRGTQSVAA
jgi:hypothetical protein